MRYSAGVVAPSPIRGAGQDERFGFSAVLLLILLLIGTTSHFAVGAEVEPRNECNAIDTHLTEYRGDQTSEPCKSKPCDTFSAWIDENSKPRKIRLVHETYGTGVEKHIPSEIEEHLFYFDGLGNLLCDYSSVHRLDPDMSDEFLEGKRYFNKNRMVAWVRGNEWVAGDDPDWKEVQNATLAKAHHAYSMGMNKPLSGQK